MRENSIDLTLMCALFAFLRALREFPDNNDGCSSVRNTELCGCESLEAKGAPNSMPWIVVTNNSWIFANIGLREYAKKLCAT